MKYKPQKHLWLLLSTFAFTCHPELTQGPDRNELSILHFECFPSTKVLGQYWGFTVESSFPDSNTLYRIVRKTDGLLITETSNDTIFLDTFSVRDTGSYYCIAVCPAGRDTSETIQINDVFVDGADISQAILRNELLGLTNSKRVKLVWLKGGYSEDGGGTLIGYDSYTSSYHKILSSTSSMWINAPHLCSNGEKIVFTDTRNRNQYGTYLVDWNGTGLRYLHEGECSDVWLDANSGQEWAIIREGGADTSKPIVKVSLEGSQTIPLWDRTGVGSKHSRVWYQVSQDGKRAATCFPWGSGPSMVVFDGGLNENGPTWVAPTAGCWYAMAPDNSYLWFHMYWDYVNNGHTGIEMYRDTVKLGRLGLDARGMPEEHFHPKFAANSSRFLTATVGYSGNASGGSDSAEVWIGRFSETFDSFEGWVQISSDSVGDYCPDAWVDVPLCAPAVLPDPFSVPHLPPGNLPGGSVTILQPETSDTLAWTDSIQISWVVSDPDLCIGWMFSYSTDSMLTWTGVPMERSLPAEERSARISCRDISCSEEQHCKVYLRVQDYSEVSLSAVTPLVVIKGEL